MGAVRRTSRIVAAVAVVGLVGGLVASGLGSAGATSTQVDLAPGTAWFASPATGQISMIDGPTAQRVVVVPAATPGDDIEVVQAGDDAYVVDRTTGTMRHVAAATFVIDPPVTIAAPATRRSRSSPIGELSG